MWLLINTFDLAAVVLIGLQRESGCLSLYDDLVYSDLRFLLCLLEWDQTQRHLLHTGEKFAGGRFNLI